MTARQIIETLEVIDKENPYSHVIIYRNGDGEYVIVPMGLYGDERDIEPKVV